VSQSCPRVLRGHGMVAVGARWQVKLVDLATCRAPVLTRIDAIDVRFSADGRWLAYSRQAGAPGTAYTASAGLFVVSVRGGRERSPLGRGVVAWSWSPKGDRLYGITTGGSLVSASPTGARQVITAHLGSGLAAFPALGISPNGRRAVVDRSRCGTSAVGELDTIDLATGARTVVLRQPKEPLIFAGFSPDGRWLLFWPDELCSASLAADGMPLQALPATGGTPVTAVGHTLLYPDFLTWCGQRLLAAAGPDRETQTASRLVVTAPPTWRQRTIDPARRLS
jgi:Tol biopolymer transport system component